jgi:hypothetical protein
MVSMSMTRLAKAASRETMTAVIGALAEGAVDVADLGPAHVRVAAFPEDAELRGRPDGGEEQRQRQQVPHHHGITGTTEPRRRHAASASAEKAHTIAFATTKYLHSIVVYGKNTARVPSDSRLCCVLTVFR